MRAIWQYTVWMMTVITIGACNNAPTPEELSLAEQGKSAILINQPDPEEERIQQLVEEYKLYMDSMIAEYNLPGAAYAIVKNGNVVAMETYGVRKNGKPELIDEHTVFRLASVSKGFASTLAGLLVDQGYIDWNDPIKEHLPKFKLRSSYHTDHVTIRHTLSQTTGLKEYAGSSAIYRNWEYSKILRSLRSAGIEEKPAKVYAYQNAIYSAISEVAKATTDMSYEMLLDSMIFGPLGMDDAHTGYKSMIKAENKAYPHVLAKRKRWKSANIRKNWYNVAPAAGINASITDMSVWLQAMLGHHADVIPDDVRKEIFKRHIPINDDSKYYETWYPGLSEAFYGMGWRVFNYKNNEIVYHGGYVRGFRPEMGFCPKEDVGIVFLTNASKNDLSSMCVHAFYEMYFAPKIAS